MSIALGKLWQNESSLESSSSLSIILISSLHDHSPSPMPGLQGSCLGFLMVHFVHESIGFHCLCFLLDLHPECSLSSLLSCFDLWYLFCVQLCAYALVVMAPVVRVEPSDMKLLDGNPELLAKVEAVGWLPFIRKFTDSNPEVTRLFSLSLADARVKVADLQFRVDERSVALATGFPLTGERWLKYKQMKVNE